MNLVPKRECSLSKEDMKSLGSATTASYVASGVTQTLFIGTDPCLRQELDAIPIHNQKTKNKKQKVSTLRSFTLFNNH